MHSKETIAQKLLGKQFLIAHFIESRLNLVNYITDGYNQNKPILINNRFLHSVGQHLSRAIIIDLYALFGKATKNNKTSFYWVELSYKNLVKPVVLKAVNILLESVKEERILLKNLRNKQIAHYDFDEKETISLTLSDVPMINKMFNTAKDIIEMFGDGFINTEISIGYAFGVASSTLNSLDRLVNDAIKNK